MTGIRLASSQFSIPPPYILPGIFMHKLTMHNHHCCIMLLFAIFCGLRRWGKNAQNSQTEVPDGIAPERGAGRDK